MASSTEPFALVVDDDAMILMHASDILQDAGFRPLEAGNVEEAKAVLGEYGESITLLFTDVEMQDDFDGFALARYAAENWPELEIVVASGRVSPQEDDMPPRATFIPKPFSADLVHGHLRDKLPDGKKPAPLRNAR